MYVFVISTIVKRTYLINSRAFYETQQRLYHSRISRNLLSFYFTFQTIMNSSEFYSVLWCLVNSLLLSVASVHALFSSNAKLKSVFLFLVTLSFGLHHLLGLIALLASFESDAILYTDALMLLLYLISTYYSNW